MGRIPDHYLPPKALWPELIVPDEFSDTPERLNLAHHLLDRHIEEGRGENPAIKYQDRTITYFELQRLVNRFGSALKDTGAQPQDRIGIRMHNSPDAIMSILAVEKIGAVPVPVSPHLTAQEMAYVIDDAEMKFLIVSAHLAEPFHGAKEMIRGKTRGIIAGEIPGSTGDEEDLRLDAMLARGSPDLDPVLLNGDDIAVILYTSGTTGLPKGCVHFVRPSVITTRLVNRYVYKIRPGDTLGGAAPVSFAAGFGTITLMPFDGGGAISLLPRFSPREMLESVARHNVTIFTGTPTLYRAVAKYPDFRRYDLSRVRLFTAGGDMLGAETLQRWVTLTGKPIWEGLGCTETLHLVTSNTMNPEPAPKSIGKPLPGVRIRIVNQQGLSCRAGEVGSLLLKAPCGTVYWKPYENGHRLLSLQESSVGDGWNRIGDAVYFGPRGNIYFVSREDDIIKSSGYRIAPAEIEEVLSQHPAVADVGVIGVPDPDRGQIARALIVLKEGHEATPALQQSLREFLKRRLATYKMPRQMEFRLSLPRSSSGKLLRRVLRAIARA
ncbi:MAG: acyl-CoA synthetase [Desulfobacteraceae bacterium]|nr:acyl-CoA synthetase [Desulfobacteraceae bacterium]